jgi:hypothetical protein
MGADDLATEVELAKRFFQAAETYLAWARMSEQLAEQLAALESGGVVSEPVTPGGGRAGGIAPTEVIGPTHDIGVRNGRPSLRRAILMVMQTEPQRVWRKREIFAGLTERGWESKGQKPTAQLATRLWEMVERGEVERVEYGLYALPGVVAKSAPVTGDESATAQEGAGE